VTYERFTVLTAAAISDGVGRSPLVQRAASHCNVTQSTFSAGIAALENLLGQPMVDRSRRQVLLTSLGDEVVEKARGIIAAATSIVERARIWMRP